MYNTNIEYANNIGSEDSIAGYCLSLCYKNGWGTDKNPELVDIWLAYAAWNSSAEAEDEFCKQYKICGDYNGDLDNTIFKHLFKRTEQYLTDDLSVESCSFKLYYYVCSCDWSNAILVANQLIDNPKVSREGRYWTLSIVHEMAKLRGDATLLNEYSHCMSNYADISDEQSSAWLNEQFAKLMWKVDVIINTKQENSSDNDLYVDFMLPSRTKWGKYNLGSSKEYEMGLLFSWGENKPKRKFVENKYKGDMNLYLLDDAHDPSKTYMNEDWSTPSIYQWIELLYYCECEYNKTDNTLCVWGPNNANIYIPLHNYSTETHYWSNTKIFPYYQIDTEKDAAMAYSFDISNLNDYDYISQLYVWAGCPIRPVVNAYK